MAANLEAASSFLNRLDRLKRGEFADIRMVCHDDTWYVHRAILLAHSCKLERLVIRSSQEGEDPEIDLSDEYPHCVQALFEYLYTFNYNIPESGRWTESEFHTRMCILAQKYALVDLKQLAVRDFANALQSDETTNDVLAEAAELAWGAPDATVAIEDEIVKEALTRDDFLLNDDGAIPNFESAMLKHPELAVAMAKAVCAKHASSAMEK